MNCGELIVNGVMFSIMKGIKCKSVFPINLWAW